MLRLILGKDWTANRQEVLRRIAEDVRAGQGGRILMVPELISHDTERRLCAAAGDTASRYAEVLSFTRLARRVADSVGSAAEECLDNGGRIVAMAAATRQLHSKLKAYAAVETRPEFLSELVDAVDEFKRCCITPADLKAASEQTVGSLAQKLEELSLIFEAYDSLCARGKRDPRDQMSWLLDQLEEGDFGQSHVFYIDGFPDFTRQHMAILEYLIQVSPCVTVSLNCDRPDSSLMAFEKAGATAGAIIRYAKRVGAELCVDTVGENESVLLPVREKLFQGKIECDPALAKHLRLRRTETVHQECTAAAERVLELARSGVRYRQISIVCADMPAYQDVLSQVFHRCGIPLYQSGTEEILHRNVISAVLCALDAALNALERRDVIRFLKSVLSPVDLDTCDALENYAILWGINGSRWQHEWESHPDGLGQEWTDTAKRRLAELNQARDRAIKPLTRLSNGFRQAQTLADQVLALYAFFEDIRLADRLDGLAQNLDSAGDNRSAQILNQLWEILLTALEQLYDVLGQTAWDGATFTRLLALLLSQYDVGTIPPVLDAVTAGPVSAMRCQQPDHLLVLGALEGYLPKYSGSKGVLTDQERIALRALGVPLTGGAMEGLQAEYAEIYGVFCGARKTITMSCPTGQPSFLYRRLLDMVGKEETVDLLLGAALVNSSEAGAYLAGWNAAQEAQQLAVTADFEDTCRRSVFTLGEVSEEHIRRLYGSKLQLSASQTDRLAECRLSYFLRYGLHAMERKEVSVDPAEFGTYVHAVLEQTARRIMELGGFHKVSQEETVALAMDYAHAYAKERFGQLESSRVRYLFQRNDQELKMIVRELWQELSASYFEPAGFEVSFGDGMELPAIPVCGTQMEAQLRGFVDRVDTWHDYFRVVDYKTGKKSIDYCDLFNGIGLQMLLYLFALEQEGKMFLGDKPLPAGVQYFPARVEPINADGRLSAEKAEQLREKLWKRSGLLLSDENVLEAMEPGESLQRLCCTRKKDGTLTGDLADREQFQLLKQYVFHILGQMVDDVACGHVEPNPYTRGLSHNACSFCPYDSICHMDTVKGRRNYKTMTAQRFWDEVRKELEGHA